MSALSTTPRPSPVEVEDRAARFGGLLEGITDALLVTDADGRIALVNAEAERMFGFATGTLVGQRIEALVPERHRDAHERLRAAFSPPPHTQATRVARRVAGRRCDGSEFQAEISLSALHDAGGVRVVAVVRDATAQVRGEEALRAAQAELELRVAERTEELRRTNEHLESELRERRRAEEALRASDERYRTLVRSFPNGALLVFDHDLRFTVAGGVAFAAVDAGSIEGRTLHEGFSPEIAGRLEPICRNALAGVTSMKEMTFGEPSYFVHALPLSVAAGHISEGILMVQDITAWTQAEHALRESEQRYRLLFERTEEAILVFTSDGAIVQANPAAAEMHGYTVAELETLVVQDIDGPAEAKDAPDRIRRILDGERLEGDILHKRRDGTLFPVHFSARPLDVGGKRLVLAFARDLTVPKQVEDALRQAKDSAEAANHAKSSFLANMSHEIRTPMNAILGYVQLLQREPDLSRTQRQSIDVISRSGEHLLNLINDVLEVSKIEAGYLKLTRGDVDLHGLLDEVGQMFELRAGSKNLLFEVSRSPSLPRHVVSDEGKLRQVLVNLLGNAVKFTARGGITTRAFVRREVAGAPRLIIEVEDTGPGIREEDLGRLFLPFSQTRIGMEAQGGTGLGLAISREFVRLLDGTITVESQLAKGSLFRVDLPCEEGSPPTNRRVGPRGRVVGLSEASCRRRILIADDDDGEHWVAELLTQVGFEVREAKNGAEAVEAFSAWSPHLILMDLNMPLLDGYAATRAIRAVAGPQEVSIVAVTAGSFDEDRGASHQAGADGWLRKPLREDLLFAEIGHHLGVTYCYAGPASTARSRTLAPSALHSHVIAVVPDELLDALRAACRAADYDRLDGLLGRLAVDQAAVADRLRTLLERFDYEGLTEALRS